MHSTVNVWFELLKVWTGASTAATKIVAWHENDLNMRRVSYSSRLSNVEPHTVIVAIIVAFVVYEKFTLVLFALGGFVAT